MRRKDGEVQQTGSLEGCISLDLSQTHRLHQVGRVIDTDDRHMCSTHTVHQLAPVTFHTVTFHQSPLTGHLSHIPPSAVS